MSSLVGLDGGGSGSGLKDEAGVGGEGDLGAAGDPAAIDGDGGTVHGVSQSIFFHSLFGSSLT
jgi:hypothetical protein